MVVLKLKLKGGLIYMYKLNLKELSGDNAVIVGEEYALSNRENGKVYTTSKVYMDKLFDAMGYKNTYVVSILAEYAGKLLTNVGQFIDNNKLFIDDDTDSFVVTTEESITFINDLMTYLKEQGFEVDFRRYDDLYYWDQLRVSKNGSTFAVLYVDLCDGYLRAYSVEKNKEGIITNLINEGKYQFVDIDALETLKSWIVAASMPGTTSFVSEETQLSINEFMDLMKSLDNVFFKKKKAYVKEDTNSFEGNLEALCDEYNSLNWLKRRITTVPGDFSFIDSCFEITKAVEGGHTTYDRFADFYSKFNKEVNDITLLNE